MTANDTKLVAESFEQDWGSGSWDVWEAVRCEHCNGTGWFAVPILIPPTHSDTASNNDSLSVALGNENVPLDNTANHSFPLVGNPLGR